MLAAILNSKSVAFKYSKNEVLSVSCKLRRDQPELSRYANYLQTIIYLQDSYVAVHIYAITVERTILLPLV